jgi:hypothetical protein
MPPLRIGHKGLHVERLDGPAYVFNMQYWPDRLIQGTGRTSASAIGVRTGGSATQPTSWTPHPRDQSADMLILMRNRAMIASHGRFLQPDLNATGLPVMGDLSFGGSALSPPRPEVELATWTTDGLNVLAYCGGDAVNRGDPTGLFAGLMNPSIHEHYWDEIEDTLEQGEQAKQDLSELVQRHALMQLALWQWLMTPDAPDHWFQMITGINFGSDGFQPRDRFAGLRGEGDEQALAEQQAFARAMGEMGGRSPNKNLTNKPKSNARSRTPGARHHGHWIHNNSIIRLKMTLVNDKRVDLNPRSTYMHRGLRDKNGKVVSNKKPDLQGFSRDGKTLVIRELVYSHQPEKGRKAYFKKYADRMGVRLDYDAVDAGKVLAR